MIVPLESCRLAEAGSSASLSTRVLPAPPVAMIASQTSTLSPISTNEVVRGSSVRLPPYGVRAWRVLFAPSRTQLGHWKPTEAEFMQSGQIGREHRWQLIQVSRSSWR